MSIYFLISWAVIIFVVFLLILKKLYWVSKIPSLRQKHVLITGGSSGIGKAVAIEAAKLGAHVTILARDIEKLKSAVNEIKKVSVDSNWQLIDYVSLDVKKEFSCIEEAINNIERLRGPIFLLVNCVGMATFGEFEKISEEDYRHLMDLNYFGTVFPTLVVGKKMKLRNKGHIVITGSQGSLLGIYGMSAYCSSKFALRGFAEALYMELLPHNVSVTLCLPPDTNTPGFENEEKSKPEVTRLISKTAGLVEPDFVASHLLSDALNKKFFSTVGFESLILTTLCSGMSPIVSLSEAFLQVFLMSLLKLVSFGYLAHFQNIITTHVKSGSKRPYIEKSD